MTAAPKKPREHRDLSGLVAWTIGSLGLFFLAGAMLSPLEWQVKLAVLIALTVLLDEFGNWFGFTAAGLGALPFLAEFIEPFVDVTAAAPQWYVAAPLVIAGLVAALIVKHAGGWFGLPFALALFLAPVIVVREFGRLFDETVTLPGTQDFLTFTLWPMVGALIVGGVIRLVRDRLQSRS